MKNLKNAVMVLVVAVLLAGNVYANTPPYEVNPINQIFLSGDVLTYNLSQHYTDAETSSELIYSLQVIIPVDGGTTDWIELLQNGILHQKAGTVLPTNSYSYGLEYTVTDPGGLSFTGSVELFFSASATNTTPYENPANLPPGDLTYTISGFTANGQMTYDMSQHYTDAETPDALTFVITGISAIDGGPTDWIEISANGTIQQKPGTVLPTASYNYVIEYTVTDPGGLGIVPIPSISLNFSPPANTPPYQTSSIGIEISFSGGNLTYDLSQRYTDAETPNSLTYSLQGIFPIDGGTADWIELSSDGILRQKAGTSLPANSYSYVIEYTVTDPGGLGIFPIPSLLLAFSANTPPYETTAPGEIYMSPNLLTYNLNQHYTDTETPSSLAYSLQGITPIDGGPADWIELSSDGILQQKAGTSLPANSYSYMIEYTVTDPGGLSIAPNPALMLNFSPPANTPPYENPTNPPPVYLTYTYPVQSYNLSQHYTDAETPDALTFAVTVITPIDGGDTGWIEMLPDGTIQQKPGTSLPKNSYSYAIDYTVTDPDGLNTGFPMPSLSLNFSPPANTPPYQTSSIGITISFYEGNLTYDLSQRYTDAETPNDLTYSLQGINSINEAPTDWIELLPNGILRQKAGTVLPTNSYSYILDYTVTDPGGLNTGFPMPSLQLFFSVPSTRIINLNGSLSFGNVNVGLSKQMIFTISNTGNSALTVSSISYPSGFIGNWSSGIIPPSGSQTVTVTFSPTAAQSYSGTMTVNSDKTEGENTIPISGTGTSVTRIIGVSGSLAFGNVNLNTGKQLSFTVSNTGNSELTVSSITYPTGFTGNWSSGTIAAGSSQSVTVTFKPTAGQTYNGTVTVNSNKTGGTNTIAASGTGISQPVSYTISGQIKDANGTGIKDVTLTFSSGGTAVTDGSGLYSKTVSSGWTGMVTPSKTGISFTPASRSYNNVTANSNDQNYTGGTPPTVFRIWIDKNGNGIYDSGEGISGASVRVNSETADRGVTADQGIISLPNIGNDAKIYAQKTLYAMSNPKAGDANFANTRTQNPYYAGSVNGKMYDFVMASDIMGADGNYSDFPGAGKTLLNALKDGEGNILVQLVHPKIGWNLVVAFEEAQSTAFYDQIKSGFRSYADFMYNYTDGYFTVKNVVLVKGAYINSAQWNYSDVQVRNSEWPNAHIFGNRYNRQTRISMGKDWGGAEPEGYNWYSTLGHESGHYLLGFGDEYMNGDYTKGANVPWTYRTTHDGDAGEPNEFPKNYGVMQSQYNGVHEISDTRDYFTRTYSSSMDPDLVTHQFMIRQGQSCWSHFKSYYQNDIKQQIAANGLTGFSDAFFSNLIIPPHVDGYYPDYDRTKRSGPALMNRDSVTFTDFSGTGRAASRSEDVFDALALVLDETGNPLADADVWLVSPDRRSFQGKSDGNGTVKCGSLLIGKYLEAYYSGRKAEIMIDAVQESYILMLPVYKAARSDESGAMVITAKPDSTNPKLLTVTASGMSLSSAPAVTLSQSHNVSVNIPMTASGTNQYSGTATCTYDSGILEVTSGAVESVSPFEIFSTEVGPASGYYAPNGELEMTYSPATFTGTGSFVIVNSSAPAPPNFGMIQVGNVYSFGFSENVTAVQNVTLNITLPENGKGANLNLYGWDIGNKTWNPVPGGIAGQKYFSIAIASLKDYAAYAMFALPQANDPNPPEPVTGFTASTGTALWNVNLQWTAPKDADAVAYDIRFSTVPVTETNWNTCITAGNIPEPVPSAVQTFTAEMPDPGILYYFGIKVIDGAGNISPLTVLNSPVKSHAQDADGDGLPDAWEASSGLNLSANDAQADDDGDLLTNLQEYQYQTDPKHSDTDRDGYSDGDEIWQGTDPLDSGSYPESAATLTDVIIGLQILAGIDINPDGSNADADKNGITELKDVLINMRSVADVK